MRIIILGDNCIKSCKILLTINLMLYHTVIYVLFFKRIQKIHVVTD